MKNRHGPRRAIHIGSAQGGVQLGLEKLLDEAPNMSANPHFQGSNQSSHKKSPTSQGPTVVFVLSVIMA